MRGLLCICLLWCTVCTQYGRNAWATLRITCCALSSYTAAVNINVMYFKKIPLHKSLVPKVPNLLPEVGSRYFSRSPLPLVLNLEIVLPLRAGPQLKKKFGSPLALLR